jgi:hypothetical protein
MKFFSQSRACEVESAWSSCFPFGNVTSSCRYCDSHEDSGAQEDRHPPYHRKCRNNLACL